MKIKFWAIEPEKLFEELKSSIDGLSKNEAEIRLKTYGKNVLLQKKESGKIALFLNQFKSPIIVILLCASLLSFFLNDSTDTYIILAIVFISGFLGFWQEKGASEAIKSLISVVKVKADVIRDNKEKEILLEETVPGDLVILKAGDLVPGDCLIIESKDLFVNEATLTGETYPVEKVSCLLEEDTVLAKRKNSLFMGTHIVSGNCKALVVNTGINTEIGDIAEHLKLKPLETEFEKGIRQFGYLLMEITLILVFLIFACNVYFHKPFLESLLFSLALAVGLTPQLLPVIISINLSHGAKKMAELKVIVKQLSAIENLGSMNILCSDKTGTLTQGIVTVKSVMDINGQDDKKAMLYAFINASFESGYTNPIDDALRNLKFDINSYKKIDEKPYDFNRKRLSILVENNQQRILITKGALKNVLEICNSVEISGEIKNITEFTEQIKNIYKQQSEKGYRVLGIAYRNLDNNHPRADELENNMIFIGLLVLEDPLKPNIKETISEFKKIGVSLKMITGDNQLVAANIGNELGLNSEEIITGSELNKISNEALFRKIANVNIFAEIEPNQKERIILAFRKMGNVTGYIGDGINDVSALHAADVSISVNSAVDIAKQTAQIVMLEKDLNILSDGIKEGRRTFRNTLKYIFMATSANFGNMFSMAGASLFLPFLPLLPKQILLTNLLTDFPEITIATDNVDPEMIDLPQKWDIKLIQKFMLVFGLISSFYDYLTFFVLLYFLHANTAQFRTGWFIESVVSASAVVLIIRSRKPFYKSRPGKYLIIATITVMISTFTLPFTPLATVFGFTPMPVYFLLIVLLIVFLYSLTVEIAKSIFYKNIRL